MIAEYLTHLELLNSSPLTIRNYRICLSRFFQVVQKDIQDITIDDVFQFRLYLKRNTDIGYNWREFHIIALKSFFKWLYCREIRCLNYEKIEINKYEEQHIEYLERYELEKMFKIKHKSPIISARNQAMLRLFYSTGCRLAELASINHADIAPHQQLKVIGKGRKYRVVFLSNDCYKAVQDYLFLRSDNYKPLFISHGRGGNNLDHRLSHTMIDKIVRTYARKAGLIKKVTPHILRHTFATELLRNGAPIMDVKDMLGHEWVTTTQIYTHVTNNYLKQAHQSYHC